MLSCRVLDLTDERGQLCGQLLADLGADVILIEPPGGSHSRTVRPFAGDVEGPERSLVHWSQNRGKRSVVLDLHDPQDRARLLDLVRSADVLVESFDPGDLDRLGLGHDVLAEANPALVHTSITAFGSDGPKASWAYGDLTLAAAAGPMALTGDRDRSPLRISLPQAFLHAGADAVGATLVALYERDHHSGRGQHVDISAQHSYSVASQSYLLSHPTRGGRASRSARGIWSELIETDVQLLWPCADGQVSITFLFGSSIGPFTRRLMEWIHDEGFCDEATRDIDWVEFGTRLFTEPEAVAEYERVKGIVTDFCATKTKAELFEATFTRRVLIAPVTTTEELLASEHFAHREFWQDVECGPHGTVRFPGPFAKLSVTPLPNLSAPAPLGAHTDEVLAEAATRPPTRVEVRGVPAAPAGTNPAADRGAAGVADLEATSTVARRPLEGLKVADFMWVFAGPWATRTLADLGADVVRVESSARLDTLRTAGQFQDEHIDPDWAVQFANVNPGKRSITLDLAHPEGRDIALDLVRWADVTTESFTPGTMADFGLDYASLTEIRPDLVMASSCLMGQTGPHRSLAGFGTMAAAVSGWFHITGWPDRNPCGPFGAYTDYVSPRFLVAAILAAVEHRHRTGRGQYIDLSQAEASMRLLGPAVLDYTVNGRIMERTGNDDCVHAPHGVFRCAGDDRWVAVAVTDDDQWQRLCDLIGCPEAAQLDGNERLARRTELGQLVETWTSQREPGEAMQALQDIGVPAHQVQNTVEAFGDPQLAHRGHFVEVAHDAMGTTWVEGSRLRLSRTPARTDHGPPTLGQHTWEVLTEVLGYGDERAAEVAASGALG
jgi:crotonobetainyl-CoA:carnitine CoA-transferase CaiB-like acyl-CoA transferase